MDHNTLVRFVAGKVGGVMDEDIDGSLSIKTVDEIEVENGRKLKVNNFYNLTSPDLFFKGLAVYPHEVEIYKGSNRHTLPHSVEIYDMDNLMKHATREFKEVSEIPQKFWECWAEVEGV